MADEYKLRKQNGWVLECHRCGSQAPTILHDWDDIGTPLDRIPKDRDPKERLCMFCYETELGNLLKYDHYRDERPMARALAQALNLMMRRTAGGSK